MQKGDTFQTSYIPEKYANLNRFVKLRNDSGEWDDGWKVITASPFRHEEEDLPDFHKDIKGHRKATGDSLPKEKA